jgi:xanthine dehydrogenase large subunit
VDLDKQGIVRHTRLAYGGVAAMTSRALKTEAALLGKIWSKETIQSVLPVLRTEFKPISDVRGSAEYRSGLITSLLEKFFHSAGDELRSLKLKSAIGHRPSAIGQSLPTSYPPRTPPHESAHRHVTGRPARRLKPGPSVRRTRGGRF